MRLIFKQIVILSYVQGHINLNHPHGFTDPHVQGTIWGVCTWVMRLGREESLVVGVLPTFPTR